MAEKFTATKEQGLAKSIDRNLSVNANAGSGKTTVLQQRLISILLDETLKVEPRELVAITFTRKAASEIFSKVVNAIEEMLQSNIGQRDLHSLLLRIRERLNSAHISTIHSFCSSLIRDFPVESGVSPNFIDLGGAEKIKLERDSINEIFTDYLLADDSNTLMLKNLITAFSKKKIEEMLRKILNKKDLFEKLNNLYFDFDEEKINRIAFDEIFSYLKENYLEVLKNAIEVFEGLIESELSGENKVTINHLLDYLDTIEELLNQSDLESLKAADIFDEKLESILDRLQEQKILTDKLILNRTTFKKILGDELDLYCEKLERFSELLEILKSFDNINLQNEMINYGKFIFDLALIVNEFLEKEKQELSALDFDDILVKTKKMLENKEVSMKVAKRFRYIMVDEFQDTNDIQYDIIKSLFPELNDATMKTHLNLFIVGDPKQSIYGFRNADVRVFRKATEDIKKYNRMLIQNNKLARNIRSGEESFVAENDNQSYGELGLTVSFRHLPVITAFTNIVCRSVMSNRDSEYDVEYSDLICSKKVKELQKFFEDGHKIINSQEFGSVKFIICDKEKKEDKENKISEAEKLVLYIQNLCATTDYKFSDIAILSRATTKFGELSQAFQKYDIPYVLHSGKGFYQAQEIIDMMSILKFLHNPGDDLSLTAALSSPYFGLEDADLLLISSVKGTTYYEKLKNIAEDETNNNLRIARVFGIITKLLNYSSRLNISHLISQVIELCGWYGSTAKSSGRAQIIANLMKLRQYASDFEAVGFRTLFDFVEEINLVSSEDVNESEAVFITDDNAVNVLTIHAAKGLEFPVVALFNSNSSNNFKEELYIDEKLGLMLKFPVYNNQINVFETKETPLLKLAEIKNTNKEKAELKRLLYVALTRAKEHLIITANLNDKKKNTSLFNLILQGMNLEPALLNTDKILQTDILQTYSEGISNSYELGFEIDVIRDISLELNNSNQKSKQMMMPAILLGEINSEVTNEVFSASRIMKFRDDIDAYYGRYVLGFRDDLTGGLKVIENEEGNEIREKISGMEEGTIIHYLMENINKWFVNGTIDKEKLQVLFDEVSVIIGKEIDETFKEKVTVEISNVIRTKLFNNKIESILSSKHEAEYNIPVLNDFLNAKIDLLFDNEGIFEIWDWKSNYITSKDEIKDLAKHYEFQMKVYAYLMMLLQPLKESYKAVLLFTKMAHPGAEDSDWTYEFVWRKSELAEFKNEIENYIIKIKGL
jgi:ATP-dependent helicase/nuclease subunit A